MIHKHIRFVLNGTKFVKFNSITGKLRTVEGHWTASNFDERSINIPEVVRRLKSHGASAIELITYDEGHDIINVEKLD